MSGFRPALCVCAAAGLVFAFSHVVSFLLFRSAFAGQMNKQEKEGACRAGLSLVFSCSRVFVRQPRRTFHEFRAGLHAQQKVVKND